MLLTSGQLLGRTALVQTWLTARSRLVRGLNKGKPCLLYYEGEFLRTNMRREHVADIELLAAMRASGAATADDEHAVVLEANSNLAVIRAGAPHGLSTLSDVEPMSHHAG